MSGGKLEYSRYRLEEIINTIEDEINNNENPPYENPDNKLGVGGKSVYRIKVLKEGEILITANYEKVSETTKKDDNDFSVTVTIK